VKATKKSRNLTLKRKEMPGWKRALRTLFRLTLLAGFCALAIHGESYFTITEIRVTGDSALPASEIIEVSGADRSRNIFMLQEKKAVQQLKEKYPQLETVEVIRSLPGSVQIIVIERVPVATVMTADGYFLIDKNTVCFELSAQQDQAYPLITGLDGSLGAPGLPLKCPMRAKILKDFFALWAENKFAELKELDLSSSYNLIIHTDDQLEIWLGDGAALEKKLLLVESSLPYLQQEGQIKLDVRSGSRLIVAGSVAIRDGEVEP
jgi:cell division septal protein FtsQ